MHTWAITIQPISEPLRINTQLPNFKSPVYQDLSTQHDWPVYKSHWSKFCIQYLKILLFLTHLRSRYPFLDIYKWFWGGSLFWGLRSSFSTHPYSLRPNYAPAYQGSCFSFIIFSIVNRGDWLEKPANIKVENNGAVGYVGSSLTVHNPLFFGHKLWLSKLMQCFYWSVLSSKW